MKVVPTSIACVCLIQVEKTATQNSIHRSCHSDIFERMYETKDRANSSDKVRNGLVFWDDGVLANNYGVLVFEDVLRDIKVERSRTFANTAGGVVVRTVTWAIVTTKVTRIGNGNTTWKQWAAVNERFFSSLLPRWVQIPITINHSDFFTRSESACGWRSWLTLTPSSRAISAAVRWRTKIGLLRHSKTAFLPSGTASRLISTLASDMTSLAGPT